MLSSHTPDPAGAIETLERNIDVSQIYVSMEPRLSVVMFIIVRIAFPFHIASHIYTPWKAHTITSAIIT